MKKRLIRKKQLKEKAQTINKQGFVNYKITYVGQDEIGRKFGAGMCVGCLAINYGVNVETVENAIRQYGRDLKI